MTGIEIFKTALSATAILNAIVSIAILADWGLAGQQQAGQVLVVWIVPVPGSLLVGILMWTQRGSAHSTGYPSAASEPMPDLNAGTHPFPPTR